MSTTRHLVNRRRRLANASVARTVTEPPPERTSVLANSPKSRGGYESRKAARAPSPPHPAPRSSAIRRSLDRLPSIRLPVVLCALIVLLGAFGALAATRADALRSDPAVRNAALTDLARTGEIKGQTAKAVAALFSYNYADTAPADKAASTLLTGKAVQQHRDMLATVRAQAKDQKLVLTTTVTESGVEMIDGSRARVLVYADQSSTRTAGKKPETTYAAAMFAVDVVHERSGTWQISAIDTFGQGS
ncbi:hypothetical protein AB0451_05800 [Streptomyces sp. NPDC052000]|uniref:hypothetical protein n=1 Tax=Streptomyces sp. NPDC052000 TaxID=3155676 RepID=UPI00344BF0CB